MKPLNVGQSALFFGASALLFRLSVYVLLPALLRQGVAPFPAFLGSYSLPLGTLLVATWWLVRREGALARWRERLRLRPLGWRQLLGCGGLFAAGFLLSGLLLPTARLLASVPALAPPPFLPDILNPLKQVPGQVLTSFMGVPLRGAYWLIGVYFVFLTLFNILGEELWFRGYLLPRQELTWGCRTWLVHGLFWCLFHTPIYPWTLLYLLPTALAVSFAAQHYRSTWAGFVVHYLGNGLLALVPIIRGVIG